MHADQGVLAWKGTCHDRPISTQGYQHMPPAFPELIIDRREPAFVDRLVAGSHPSKLAEPVVPAVSHPTSRFLINVELPEAGLSSESCHSRHQGRIVFGDDSLLRWNVDHAVVTGNDHCHLRRQGGAQPLAHRVDSRQLLQPVSRIAPVYVPVMIKLALVGVDHTAITTPGCFSDQCNP